MEGFVYTPIPTLKHLTNLINLFGEVNIFFSIEAFDFPGNQEEDFYSVYFTKCCSNITYFLFIF